MRTVAREVSALETAAPSVAGAAPSKRCVELDGLRGMAALCAVLWHYTDRAARLNSAVRLFRHAVSISPAGMDMFFVLSGFLIGGILLKTKESPNYYKTFYLRRFHRIIPIYYFWIVGFGVAAFFAPAIRQTLPKGYTLPLVMAAYPVISAAPRRAIAFAQAQRRRRRLGLVGRLRMDDLQNRRVSDGSSAFRRVGESHGKRVAARTHSLGLCVDGRAVGSQRGVRVFHGQ